MDAPPPIPKKKERKMYFRAGEFTSSHAPRPEVVLGEVDDRTDLFTFLLNLPLCWTAEYRTANVRNRDKSKSLRYPHCLEIGDGSVKAFELYWNVDFTQYTLYATQAANWICRQFFTYVPEDDRFELEIRRTAMEEVRCVAAHPYTCLSRKLFGKKLRDATDPSIEAMLDQTMLRTIEMRLQRDQNSRDILAAIKQLKGGDGVSIKYSSFQSANQLRLDKGKYLYRMVWVFPQAISLLKQAAAVLVDGTHSVLKPAILELLLVVVSNEALPVALCVTPTESKDSINDLYDAVLAALRANGERPELLTDLPLVTDQGSALVAFVRERNVIWRLCHRHLIENFGASSPIGSWVARLLRCCSFNEYQHVRDVIKEEVKMHYPRRPFPKGYEKLQRMLNPPAAEQRGGPRLSRLDFIFQLDHWARWFRTPYGCPTTSNAIESIHARLNARRKPHQLLFTRIVMVINYCRDRYRLRNHPQRVARRASNRFLNLLETRPSYFADANRDAFYRQLNSRRGTNTVVKNWLFPEDDLTQIHFDEEVYMQEVTGDLPDIWKAARSPKSKTDEETLAHADPIGRFLGDFGIDKNGFPSGYLGLDNVVHSTAWDIICSIRSQFPRAWDLKLLTIIPETIIIGALLHSESHVDLTTAKGEALWRYRAYRMAKGQDPPVVEAPPPETQIPPPQLPVRMIRPAEFVCDWGVHSTSSQHVQLDTQRVPTAPGRPVGPTSSTIPRVPKDSTIDRVAKAVSAPAHVSMPLHVGLPNEEEKCYLIVVLQVLYHIPRIREILLRIVDGNDNGFCIGEVFRWMNGDQTNAIGETRRDQCVHLLSCLESQLGMGPNGDPAECLEGLLEQLSRSTDPDVCRFVSDSFHFHVKGRFFGDQRARVLVLQCSGCPSLDVALENCFVDGDSLPEGSISQLPNFLAIRLNLMTEHGELGGDPFRFPNRLDLRRYTRADAAEYMLAFVITHMGGSSTRGHYVAYCLIDGSWWVFNDDHPVISVRAETVFDYRPGGKTPYLLVYSSNSSRID
jgi:hypothetical protein